MNENEQESDFDLENNSTTVSEVDSPAMEEKASFFSKIKQKLTQKKLTGEKSNVKTTRMGFSDWEIKRAIYDGIQNISDKFSSIFKKSTEPETKNGFNTAIIGKENPKPTPEQELAAEQAVNKFLFPGLDPSKIGQVTQPKENTIIDNSKTAEDVEEIIAEKGTDENIDVSHLAFDKEGLNKAKEAQKFKQPTPKVNQQEQTQPSPQDVSHNEEKNEDFSK